MIHLPYTFFDTPFIHFLFDIPTDSQQLRISGPRDTYRGAVGPGFVRPLVLASQTLLAIAFPIDVITSTKSGLSTQRQLHTVSVHIKVMSERR